MTLRRRTFLCVLLLASAGCAYYNVFYLARKNFDQASQGVLYPPERASGAAAQGFDKSINFSKLVISRYPKSKWVDDAYLLWARGLLGKGDPFQAIDLLEKFDGLYPGSPVRAEAMFFLAVAYRHARKLDRSLATLDSFQTGYPRHPYGLHAWLERARVQLGRKEWRGAQLAAREVMGRAGRKQAALVDQALRARAQAYFEAGVYDSARLDYQALGSKALTDDERLEFVLRQADCLARAGDHAAEIGLLDDQLRHEAVSLTGGALNPRRARLLLALGSAYGRAGEAEKAVGALGTVVADYPKQPLAAEAQYQLGYHYEVHGRDFARARTEYAKVREHSPGSSFVAQAQQRVARLDRLEQLGAAAGDTLSREAEREFGVGENYLFELNQPERALEQYLTVATRFPRTRTAARALNAAGWVLSRKLGRQTAADSLHWRVVIEHKGTEEALAARDYLEYAGHAVPDSLIEIPAPPPPDTLALRAPPDSLPADSTAGPHAFPDSLRLRRLSAADSLMMRRIAGGGAFPGGRFPFAPRDSAGFTPFDTTRRLPGDAPTDTTLRRPETGP